MKKLKKILFLLFTLFTGVAGAQVKILKGKIISSKDSIPVIGATISLKNSKIKSSANAYGGFSLSLPNDEASLIVTAVGFVTKEIDVKKIDTDIIVMLDREVKVLSDVVVVGYNTQKRSTLTGAVSEVKGTEIIKTPSVNVSNNLVGRIPGLISTNESGEPGADGANILIRGINTFSGSTAPLIVIDGVANRPGGFERLNPNDIESISILKDASAAIYGAQAANGVILISSKRGKSGKVQMNINSNIAINNWAKVPKLTNAAQYAELINEADVYNGQSQTYSTDEIQKFKDGSDPISYPNTNWIKEAVKDYVVQNRLNLSLRGGSDKVNYYASIGRLQQDGQFKNSSIFSYKQYNLLANIDAQLTNNFKLAVDMQLRHEDRVAPTGSAQFSYKGTGSDGSFTVFSGLLDALPIYPARYPNGLLGSPNGGVNYFFNPLATSSDIAGRASFRDIYSLNTLRYTLDLPWLLRGLYVDGFVSADLQNSDVKDFSKTWNVYYYDRTSGEYVPSVQSAAGLGLAAISQRHQYTSTITVNSKINFKRDFNDHSLYAFIAFEQQKYSGEYFSASRNNFATDNVPVLDYGSPVNATNGGNSVNTARRNYFGRLNYGYKEKYLLEAQFRYDGSDKFPAEKRWGLFPSVSAGWVISEETWFKNSIKAIDNLKIRLSWGRLGNDAINPYQFLQFYNFNSRGFIQGNGQIVPTLEPDVLANPNFTWETAESKNIGIDGSLFEKKLNFTVEWFSQKRSDVLSKRNATVPLYTGLNLPVENIGIVQNKGIEGQLNYHDNIGQVNYSIGGNITYARNKVLFFDEPQSVPEYQRQTGAPINSGLFFIANGLFQNQQEIDAYPAYNTGQTPRPGDVKFEDVNKDGKIDFFDMKRLDLNNTPEIVYGINMGLSWQGFDLSILFQGQARSKVFFYPQSSSLINFYYFLYDGRSTPDKVTDKPSTAGDFYTRPQFNSNTLPFFRRNTSFVRLKNVELGYNLSSSVMKRLKITNMRVYINGSNLLTFAHFNDVDPESLNRLDGKGYPILRTVNIGVSLNF